MIYSAAATEAIIKRFRDRSPKHFMDNPESYLGPNYAAVINFWIFTDSLTREQYGFVSQRWWAIRDFTANLECIKFLNEIDSLILDIDENFILHFFYNSEQRATEELIVMHKLLEEKHYDFPFIKMYQDL